MTRAAIESFRDALVGTCSRSTAQRVLVSFKSLLADAQRRGLIAQNVATGTKVKMAGRHEKRAQIPTKDEIRAMLAKTSELWPATSPWRAFIVTSLFTGMRPS